MKYRLKYIQIKRKDNISFKSFIKSPQEEMFKIHIKE